MRCASAQSFLRGRSSPAPSPTAPAARIACVASRSTSSEAFVHQRLAAGEDGDATAVSAAELLARQAFVEHVEAQRVMGIRELERHEADVANCDNQLGYAAREHEILERLKDRQRAEHEREAGRRENAQLDEIALERFRRSAA